MDKASKAIRRSSVRLKSLNSGHGDLNMVISDFGEVGSTLKAFISSQTTACHDTLKWAFKEKNLVLKEALQHFNELQALWTQVQLEFIAGIKKFRRQYEIILEGEQQIDKCRAHLSSCEARENKLRKDLKKAISKASGDGRIYEERLYAVKSLVKSAQTELNDKVSNHEAVKMIAIKEGFINISESYLELAEKAIFIFEAYEGIAKGLPDVNDNDIQNIKYTGSEAAKRSVIRAKEAVYGYKRADRRIGAPPPTPPDYSKNPPPMTHLFSFHNNLQRQQPSLPSQQLNSRFSNDSPNFRCLPQYDLPPDNHYTNLDEGAVGGPIASDYR